MPPFDGMPSAAPPVAGAGSSLPGQPPFGASPLTMPAAHRGQEAAASALLRNAVDMLTKALAGFGPGSEPGQAILKSISSLSKHVPQGATTPGAQNTAMQQFMMEHRQLAPLLAALAAMKQGGGAGAPGAGAAPPPMPPGPPGAPMNPQG